MCTLICHIHISHLSDFPQWTANSSLDEIQTSHKTDSWFWARSYQFLIITWALISTQFRWLIFHQEPRSSNGSFLPTLKSPDPFWLPVLQIKSSQVAVLSLYKAGSDGELLLLSTLFLLEEASLLSVWLLEGHCPRKGCHNTLSPA